MKLMKNKKILKFFFLFALLMLNLNCGFSLDAGIPYFIKGEIVTDVSCDYQNAGFDFTFMNRADKTVKDFTVVFYVFDENGEPPLIGRNNIVFKIKQIVEGRSSLKSCVSLDDFIDYIPEGGLQTDFLYISHITYEDDSNWSDPLGMKIF